MKMTPGQRALDKIYKRRNKYQIPDWQRDKVWGVERKQELIDSILRGWKLPKFYFLKIDEDDYEVVDGQQRLTTIYEFLGNELSLADESVGNFGGPLYRELKPKFSDAFDDFEIEFDLIEDASEDELKQFFQRLQQGLPLTSSEKLNSIHSKLRDFCKAQVKHLFFTDSINVANTRFAHFDIMAKAAAIEIGGIGSGLRFDDIRDLFNEQKTFSGSSAAAKRIKATLDFLRLAFPVSELALRNRTIVQSVISTAARLVETNNHKGLEAKFGAFATHFVDELATQVELGHAATDYDYIRFQRTVNANVKAGAKLRQEIMMRKAFMFDASLAAAFDPSVIIASGVSGRVKELGESITEGIGRLNAAYGAKHGEDLFKMTNKSAQALSKIGKPAKDFAGYKSLVDELYFVFREAIGQRLNGKLPQSFVDVNTLRTDLQHDVDHGENKKVKAKKKKIGTTFQKFSGALSPQVLDADRFVLVQANLLSALELDLKNMSV